jgi:general secretion pathway protein M
MRWIDGIREYWEKLSERERRMLGLTGGVLAAMIIFVAVWTTSSALADVQFERDEIRRVLTDIDIASEALAKRLAEREAVKQRYQNKTPALAAYVESKAKDQGLEVRQVLEEPRKEVTGYRKQGARVTFQGASLRPIVRLLTSIEEDHLPVAVERLQIQHYSAGDNYKVDIGVVGFEVATKTPAPAAKGPTEAPAPEAP